MPGPAAEAGGFARLRTFLLAIFVFGTAGTLIELLLLEHWDGWTQWTPIALLAASLVVLAWHGLDPGVPSLRVFQGVMVLSIAGGLLGLVLHYRGNAEFELEMSPALRGWALFRDSMAGATPALAPGTMVQLGLLGLAYTFRHPALGASRAARAGAGTAESS
ncbi:MAG: hypothetical protein ACRENB_07710 [Gemmatimonadales bacterium]